MLSDRETHPKKVLDVGCGSGAWCINAASLWPDTYFVGLDLVAIQPDPCALERFSRLKHPKSRTKLPQLLPRTISSKQSQSTLTTTFIYNRIKWVHHNFLKARLPFEDDEFDLVRVRCIAQGVPEDKVSANSPPLNSFAILRSILRLSPLSLRCAIEMVTNVAHLSQCHHLSFSILP